MKSVKENKILISGFEIGGQMQLLAESFRKRWIGASAVAYNDDFRGYQNDINLSKSNFFTRLVYFIFALRYYNIFHFFWGVSMLNFWRFHLVDLPILKFFNKKIIVHFRGLDVIDIKYFDYLREKSRGEPVSLPPLSRPDQLEKLKKWLKYADVVLVSEPDLYEVVPEEKAILSPQVVDVKEWVCSKIPLSEKDGIIRIVHAPTSRRKKGTDFIEEAVQVLTKKGYQIELILAEKMPSHKIKELYEISDIGIDQILYGWHGKVSVELMALGKPVICFIDPRYQKYRPDLPIVNANTQNLVEVLENLIKDKELRLSLGRKGIDYATKYHDIESITDQLLELYGMPKNKVLNELTNVENW